MEIGAGTASQRAFRASRRIAGIGLVALFLAAAVAPPALAEQPQADALAARICGEIFAKLGFERFQRRFMTPEACAEQVAREAAAAVDRCAEASDREECVRSRVRTVVSEYAGEHTLTGGIYSTRSGARVRVVSVDGSGVRDGERRSWAELLDSLVHGSELETVTLHLGSVLEVQSTCGPSALACYFPGTRTIVAAVEDQPVGPDAESLVAHEYGHHVANSRLNPPWSALARGTKRWATYMGICARVRSHELTRSAIWGASYRLLPAEGFAEAFRVLNERRLAHFERPTLLVDERFYPDANAIRLLEQDVTDPWLRPTTVTLTGRGSRSFRLATPLDGSIRVSVSSAPGTVYRVSAPGTICGRRTTVVRVQRVRGDGAFRLVVSRP